MNRKTGGDGLNVVGSGPPPGSSWTFARPERLVQCCWCGVPILPGDYAMVVIQDTPPQRRWWSHYDSRPCFGRAPAPEQEPSDGR